MYITFKIWYIVKCARLHCILHFLQMTAAFRIILNKLECDKRDVIEQSASWATYARTGKTVTISVENYDFLCCIYFSKIAF